MTFLDSAYAESRGSIMIRRSPDQKKLADKKTRKHDALELAGLIYDVFKEEKANAKIERGQNNAQQTSGN